MRKLWDYSASISNDLSSFQFNGVVVSLVGFTPNTKL